jgi:probable HAF family extracellular repeat protein
MKHKNSVGSNLAQPLLLAATALVLALAGTVNLAWAAKPPKPPPPPPPAAPYTYLYLGGLGGSSGYAYAVNNAGQVVGDSLTTAGMQHAFIVVPQDTNADGKPDLWNPTGTILGLNPRMTDLGVPEGAGTAAWSRAEDINDLGNVLGSCAAGGWIITPSDTDGDGSLNWFLDDGSGANALMIPLWLGEDYATDLQFSAINNPGHIVGSCSLAGFVLCALDTNQDGRPDTWFQDANQDGLNDLFVALGRAFGLDGALANLAPSDINDAGQIAGYVGRTPFLLTPRQTAAGLVWAEDLNGDGENDLIVRLPLPPTGSGGYAPLVVNNQGSVAGNYRTSKGTFRAMFWRPDAQGVLNYTDLGVPNSETHIRSQGINDSDQVVGDALLYGNIRGTQNTVRSWSGWLWNNGVMADVRTLMDKSAELADRYMFTAGINNAGLMVGFAGSVTVGSTGGPAGYYPWIAVPTP